MNENNYEQHLMIIKINHIYLGKNHKYLEINQMNHSDVYINRRLLEKNHHHLETNHCYLEMR